MMERPTDENLAIRAREGSAAAFEELFNKYKKPLLNYIYRIVGNRATAEEVAQDVFMKTYKNLYLFDPGRKFSTWIYTIARNQAKNALRDRKYNKDVSLENVISEEDKTLTLKDVIAGSDPDPSLIAESEELEKEAQKVLDSMPLEYREVITLCSIQGMTYKEASGILGCSIASISIRLNKAKELFINMMGMDSREKGSGSHD